MAYQQNPYKTTGDPQYPSSPPPVHTDAGPVAPYQQNAQMTNWDQPNPQFNPGWQNQPPPAGGYYGPPYPQQPMYYQQPGYGPPYGAYDDRGYGRPGPSAGEGFCAAMLAALACCCCLDFLI